MIVKAISLRCFPLSMPWKECLQEASRSGYKGVEINFDGRFPLDIDLPLLKEIKEELRKQGLKAVSVYSRQQWKTPISSRIKKKREKGVWTLRRLMEIAEILESPIVLTIPGAVDNSILSSNVEIRGYKEVYEQVGNILKELSREAEKREVVLALENVPNKFLLSPLEMKRFIEEINSTRVGCYLDVANALYNQSYPEDWIRILGGYIKAVHLKDFRRSVGNWGGFVNIFEGDINWEEVCKALGEIDYQGALTAEVLPPFKYHPEVLWKSVSLAIDLLIKDMEHKRERV